MTATVDLREPVSGQADHAVAGRPWRFGLAFPLGVYLLTRLYGFVLLSWFARRQRVVTLPQYRYYMYSPQPAHPGYLGIITNWDGQWYESLARSGYPALGHGMPATTYALQAWAFPPVYPFLVRAVMWTGLSFPGAASVVDGMCGALAMVLMFVLLERQLGRLAAMTGVTLTCCFITAPLLQTAYSESLALLLLVVAFLCLTERKYWLGSAVIVVLGFTRIITVPFGIVVALHALARGRRRDSDPMSRRELAALATLELASMAGAVSWSLIARIQTPVSTAASGRVSGAFAHNWFVKSYEVLGWRGTAVVVVIVALLGILATRRSVRDWGLELRTWLWSYPLYLLAVTPMSTGVLRYLLLCFPAGLLFLGNSASAVHAGNGNPVAANRLRAMLVVVVAVGGLALQWWWVGHSLAAPGTVFMP